MVSPRAASFTVLIFLFYVMQVGCSSPENPEPKGQIVSPAFVEEYEARMSASLCSDERYLSCLGISAEECKADMKEIAPICTKELITTIPDPETNTTAFGEFGRRYGSCLMKKHFDVGKFDRKTADACLNQVIKESNQ